MVLEGLELAADPGRWADLGFTVAGDTVTLGGVAIRLTGAGAGEGITGWRVRGLDTDVLPAADVPSRRRRRPAPRRTPTAPWRSTTWSP